MAAIGCHMLLCIAGDHIGSPLPGLREIVGDNAHIVPFGRQEQAPALRSGCIVGENIILPNYAGRLYLPLRGGVRFCRRWYGEYNERVQRPASTGVCIKLHGQFMNCP